MDIYKKNILSHSPFYISAFTKSPDRPYLIFVHGGPGLNCGLMEYLIEHDGFFGRLNYNLAMYDQRNCGKSPKGSRGVLHKDNVDDLEEIIRYLVSCKMQIHGLIGHSYGAKLLFDYYKKYGSTIPGVFISTANSILTPRINNLILDLAYLKKTDPMQYKHIYNKINNLSLDDLWYLTDELAPLFQENKERPYLYWANLECFELTKAVQERIKLPIDEDTFKSVRKDLYSSNLNMTLDIPALPVPYLWVNGFHDFIVNSPNDFLCDDSNKIYFYKSSHYPHLEENDRFCEMLNEFFEAH